MSFDDYVIHIAEKYRLAAAIAVIQSKPENITLEEYIITLRDKLNGQTMDTDFDESISSGDFEYDSVDHGADGSLGHADGFGHVSDVTATNTEKLSADSNTNNIQSKNSKVLPFPENLSQITFFEETQNNLPNNTINPIQQNDSQITYYEENQYSMINDTVKDDTLTKFNEPAKSDLRDKNVENDNFNKIDYINTNDLQETQIYTVPEFLQYYTHYSESQCDIIAPVGNKYIINKEKPNIINKEQINNEDFFINYSQNAQDMNLYFDQTPNMDFIFEENLNGITQNDLICDSIDINYNYDKTGVDNLNNDLNGNKENEQNSIRTNTADVNNQTNVLNDEEMNKHDDDVEIEEVTETNEEIVPFKIIEELNKVKVFLKKRDEKIASDSGFRSESQGKNFRNGSQLSVSSVNQSANCLLEYVKTCPLLCTTREIIKEISEILGSLVDKLHEDETYPPFIEVLLETIELSLRQIIEGDSSSGNALSIKDDIFQRILFINKSNNIQKYTINNISKYIENFTSELHGKDTYETTNINTIENVCYVLYILEIIITDYTKNRSLPTTQSSQDEGKLKRSSLSDVWRRKWNPSCEETKQDGGGKEKCVLEYCSEVLNKLTVKCMENYCLISYSALKCYNLLQTV